MKSRPRHQRCDDRSADRDVISRAALARMPGARMSEEAIHREVVKHIIARLMPGVVWWHTPNGDHRNPGVAGRLKAMGTRPGIPDLMFLRRGQLYGLELKRLGGRTSPHQDQRHSELAAAGAIIATVQGLDNALGTLVEWRVIHAGR